MKQRLFIASSVEGLDVAYALQEALEYDFEVTVWPQGVFGLSKTTLDDLVESSDRFDAAVFVFSPDDTVVIRDNTKKSVRDNVLFELGLFVGALGRDKCFIVKPRSFSSLQFPTDLLGMNPGDYDDARQDQNLVAAVGPTANKIRRALVPKQKRTQGTTANTLEQTLLSSPWLLVFNPKTKRSKRIVFAPDGLIVEGNNRNEHKWRIVNGKLELVQLDGRVHSRFVYDKSKNLFRHTDDPDTLAIRGQRIIPERD